MSQKQQSKFLPIYGIVVAVGVAGLGYLWWSARERHAAAEEAIESAITHRDTLRRKPIFPNKENVQKKKEQVAEFAKQVDALQQKAVGFQRPFKEESTDGKSLATTLFAETLPAIKAKTEALISARNAGAPGSVTLPEGFNFGMEKYSNAAPLASAAPALDYQLEAIDKLLDILLKTEGGVKSLDYFHRTVQPDEIKPAAPEEPNPADKTKKAGPQKAADKKTGKDNKKEPAGPVIAEAKILKRSSIQLAFTASSRAVYGIMNALVNIGEGGPLFTINNLRVENVAKEGPDIGGTIEPTEVPDADIGYAIPEGAAKPRIDAQYVVGNEHVKVYMELDLVHINSLEETAKVIKETMGEK